MKTIIFEWPLIFLYKLVGLANIAAYLFFLLWNF